MGISTPSFAKKEQELDMNQLRDEVNILKSKLEATKAQKSDIELKYESSILEIQKLKKDNFSLKEDIYELNQKNYHL